MIKKTLYFGNPAYLSFNNGQLVLRLPEVEKNGTLYAPRIARILSHIEEGSICYSVQFEVENSAKLHRWHQEQGVKLNEELLNIFKDKVIGFPTLMEVIV